MYAENATALSLQGYTDGTHAQTTQGRLVWLAALRVGIAVPVCAGARIHIYGCCVDALCWHACMKCMRGRGCAQLHSQTLDVGPRGQVGWSGPSRPCWQVLLILPLQVLARWPPEEIVGCVSEIIPSLLGQNVVADITCCVHEVRYIPARRSRWLAANEGSTQHKHPTLDVFMSPAVPSQLDDKR